MIHQVELTPRAKKQIKRLPCRVVDKLLAWVEAVQLKGLEEVRKSPGFHDEALKGKRRGQRSIRLSLHYRAIYQIHKDSHLEFVSVEEVNKHAY